MKNKLVLLSEKMQDIFFKSFAKLKRNSKNTATAGIPAVAGFVLILCMILLFAGCDMAPKEEIALTVSEETAALIDAWQPKEIHEKEQTDRLIAHGGASVDGYQTSNSAEAVMHAADSGFKLIELDFNMTSDDRVVLVHDWDATTTYYYQEHFDGPISHADFTNRLSYGRFHTMGIENLIAILDKSDSFKIVTDAKEANMRVLESIARDYPDYLDRFIPQIYGYEQYEKVKEWGYDEIILTLYQMPFPIDAQKIVRFYNEKNLYAITIVDEGYMQRVVKALLEKDVKIYRHPVSNYERYEKLLEEGNYGVYTSSLTPEEIVGPNAGYYITMPDEDDPEKTVKLTDYAVKGDTVEEVVALQVHGLGPSEYRIYYIGDDGVRMTNQGLDQLPYGKVHMPVEIWEVDKRFVGHFTGRTLDYYIWKDENGVRILDSKYEYRADLRKVIPKMEDFSGKAEVDPRGFEKLTNILKRSFVAKAGEYYYYNEGKSGSFLLESEFFYAAFGPSKPDTEGVQSSTEVYLPVAEAAKSLGASKVGMNDEEEIFIEIPKGILESSHNQNYKADRNKYPYMPFLQKTLISGNSLGSIFERDVLEGEESSSGIIIILPRDISASDLTDKEIKRLLTIAARLYE